MVDCYLESAVNEMILLRFLHKNKLYVILIALAKYNTYVSNEKQFIRPLMFDLYRSKLKRKVILLRYKTYYNDHTVV